MNFDFAIPEPLKLGVPTQYYEELLSNYQHFDTAPTPGFDLPSRLFGACLIGPNEYEVRGDERNGKISAIEILGVRETDSFLGISLSLPSRKFVRALRELGYEFEHGREGIIIPREDGSIALSYQFGRVVAICWDQ